MTTEADCACVDLGRLETHDCDLNWRRAINNGWTWDTAHMINWWFDQVALRVTLGAMRLDGIYPGWAPNVNADRLDMGSANWCVLGQLYEGFFRGIEALGMDSQSAEVAAHGFNRYSRIQWVDTIRAIEQAGGGRIYHDYPDVEEEYRLLDRIWRREIAARTAN